MSEKVDFEAVSAGIIAVLDSQTDGMHPTEKVRHIYNNAIEDATNFVRDMGKSNPDIKLACMRLEREMKEWLPLR